MIVQWTQGAYAQMQIGPQVIWTFVTGDAGEVAAATGRPPFFMGRQIGRMGSR